MLGWGMMMRDLRRLKDSEEFAVCSIAAAVIGSAVIGAGAGIIGSKSAAKTQSQAALSAAEIQAQAANRAADLQLQMFNTIRGDLAPGRALYGDALSGYRSLLGLPSSTAIGAPATGAAPSTTVAPASTAPMKAGDFNWAQVLKDRPDVLAEYNKVIQTADKNSPWYAQHGLDKGPEGFAEWWYNNNRPQGDTYAAPQWTQDQINALYPQGGGTTAANTNTAPATGQPALSSDGIQSYLESLPGYKFVRDQGIKSTTNALASKGLGGISGAFAKGISRFVTGLADTTYGSQLDRVAAAVNTGQNAATQTGSFGTQAGQGASSSLIAGANAAAGGITGAANANAAGTIGAANAIAGGANNAANALLTSRILAGNGTLSNSGSTRSI